MNAREIIELIEIAAERAGIKPGFDRLVNYGSGDAKRSARSIIETELQIELDRRSS